MRWTFIILTAALAVQGMWTVPARASSSDIVDVPVSFSVHNTDTSRVPCPSDGKTYVVRGHLTGPRAAIEGPAPRAVTLHSQGRGFRAVGAGHGGRRVGGVRGRRGPRLPRRAWRLRLLPAGRRLAEAHAQLRPGGDRRRDRLTATQPVRNHWLDAGDHRP